MDDATERIKDFIECANVFTVMGEFKRQGLLTKQDMSRAMSMTREDWITFMKQKAGIESCDDPEI